MRHLFDGDSTLVRVLNKMADLCFLNLAAFLFCLPVVTAGASFAAMHYVIIEMHDDLEGSVLRQFFKEFRRNLKGATPSWLIIVVLGAALVFDFRYAGRYLPGPVILWFSVFIALSAMLIFCFLYIFPLHAWYENTLSGTWKNAALLSVAYLPRTVGMLLIDASIILFLTQFLPLLPLFFLFGFSVPAYLRAYLYIPVLKSIKGSGGKDKFDETDGE